MKKSIGTYKGDKLYLSIGSYKDNGRIYIGIDTNKESYSNLTINLSDLMIPDDNYIFVSGDMTKEVKNQLEKCGILSNYLYSVDYNMGNYDCYSINLDKLKHYDPVGFEDSGLELNKTDDLNYDVKI